MSHNFPETRVGKGRPLAAELWRNDVTISYSSGDNEPPEHNDRGEITELSRASLKRLAFVAHNTHVTFDTLTTLTYPAKWESDGRKVKHQFYRWLKWSRRTCGVDSYLWALEFQRRGAPHFHIFTAGGLLLKSKIAVSSEWYYLVGSNDEKHLKAGTRVERLRVTDAAGRYAAKYASKPYQKAVPPDYRNVGRFWGNSYDVKPVPLAKTDLDGWGELIEMMSGWDYSERLEQRKPIATLYNAGKFLQEKFNNEGE